MDYTLITIIAYLVLSTAAGSIMVRRTKTSSSWSVASSGMSVAMIACGIAGTRIGGAATYGVAGDVINSGVWNGWWYGITTFLAFLLTGLFFAVYYRRLKLHTVGELFTIRYGSRRCQWLTSLCVQTEYAIVNLIEAYVVAVILSALTPISMFWGTMVAATIFATYVSLGGLWGTALSNVIHCAVIVAGLLVDGLMGIAQLGGWDAVTGQVDAYLAQTARDPETWWAFTGTGWLPILGMFFSATIHTPAASIYVNYSTAARSERTIAPAFVWGGVLAGVMPMLAGVIGILTAARYGFGAGLSGYRNLTALASDISPIIGGIALAAVLAAVISSGGPILLSSATMLVRDWLPFAAKYSSDEKLRAYRVTTIIYAFVAAVAAWLVATRTTLSILDLLLFGFAMVVPPAIALGYTIYWRRTTEPGCYWGMINGYGAGLLWFALIKWALWVDFSASESSSAVRRLFAYCFTYNGEGIDPSYATTIVPLVVVPLVSLLTKSDEGTDFYDALAGRKTVHETV